MKIINFFFDPFPKYLIAVLDIWKVSGRCLESVLSLEGVWKEVRSGQIMSGQVKSGQVESGQVESHLRMEFDSGVGPTCIT